MKKLLSLLSALTISGTAVPRTIAASPYQKQEKLNNNINYLQTNNLENLNRNKINNSNNFKLSKNLNINYDITKYFKELCLILGELVKKGVILPVNDEQNAPISCNKNYFVLNRNTSFNYFIAPIILEDSRHLELVFRTSDLYLQCFINNIENNSHTERDYWFFDYALIQNINDVLENHNLGFDSNYNTLLPSDEALIRWTGIVDAVFQLTNAGTNRPPSIGIIRGSLARVILATLESIRFRQVRNNVIQNYDTHSPTSNWGHYRSIITNWGSITQNAINYLTENGNLNNFVNIGNILIFSIAMYNNLNSCGNIKNLNKRSLSAETCIEKNIIYWNNLYHLNLSGWGNEKITLPNNVKVTSIKVLQKDSESRSLSSGETSFVTTNGVYLKHVEGQIDKFYGLDFLITYIELDNKGSAYVFIE